MALDGARLGGGRRRGPCSSWDLASPQNTHIHTHTTTPNPQEPRIESWRHSRPGIGAENRASLQPLIHIGVGGQGWGRRCCEEAPTYRETESWSVVGSQGGHSKGWSSCLVLWILGTTHIPWSLSSKPEQPEQAGHNPPECFIFLAQWLLCEI